MSSDADPFPAEEQKPASVPPGLKEGMLIANKYELLRKLGTGAMGEVWAARHLSLDEEVAIKLVKRDVEHAFVGTAAAAAAGGAAVARVTASAQAQITGFGTSTFAAQSGNVFYMNTAVNLTETVLVAAIQAAYTAGGDPTRILVTPSNSLIVAAFASAAGRYRIVQESPATQTKLVNAVNLYVSPFGEQVVEVDRFLKAKSTLIYDPDMWAQATLRPWTRENLAKVGDSERQLIVGELGLKHKNYSASALVIDNAASGS